MKVNKFVRGAVRQFSYWFWKLITKEGYITMAVCITVMGMLLMM